MTTTIAPPAMAPPIAVPPTLTGVRKATSADAASANSPPMKPPSAQLGHVAGAVEGVDADEDVLVVFVPADAGAGAEGFGQARFGA